MASLSTEDKRMSIYDMVLLTGLTASQVEEVYEEEDWDAWCADWIDTLREEQIEDPMVTLARMRAL